MVACHRHTGCTVAFLHAALVLDALDKIILGTGIDIEIGAQLGIHLKPVFVVRLNPVNFAVVEGEVSDSAQHLLIAAQIIHAIILRQAVL